MQITKATSEDIPALARLWHVGWHQGHAAVVSPELVATRQLPEFATRLKAHLEGTYVARIGGALAGFFTLEGRELYQFYVDAGFQGKGVAARLMAEAEAALPRGSVWLACSVGNARAARFYEKCGWVLADTITYEVEATDGPLPVRVWRYEKDLS